jgi:hypothetical protein
MTTNDPKKNDPDGKNQPIVPEPVHEIKPLGGGRLSKTGGRSGRLDPATKNAILSHIRKVGYHLPSLAAIAGVKPGWLGVLLKRDEEFDLEIQQARAVFLSKLEAEAFRRAVEGWDVPITIAGQADVVRKFSDQLLLHMLKKSAPDKHGDKVEINQHTTVDTAERVGQRFDMNRLDPSERATLRKLLSKAKMEDEPEM